VFDTTGAISGKAALQKEIKRQAGNPEASAMEHLELAMLLVHKDNPAPDLKRARAEIDIFLKSHKGKGADCMEAAKVVRHFVDKAINAEVELGRLRGEVERLQEESRLCEENIKKLQSIDIQMERKRKSFVK
jgi:predicted ATP-grasp superfamily ATP-dependent carboligase